MFDIFIVLFSVNIRVGFRLEKTVCHLYISVYKQFLRIEQMR